MEGRSQFGFIGLGGNLQAQLTLILFSCSREGDDSGHNKEYNEVKFILKELPLLLSELASCAAFEAQNLKLRYLLDRACLQIEKNHVLKVLMYQENGRLCKKLFDKSKKKRKKTMGYAHHMTSDEVLDALARDEWAAAMKEVFKERVWQLWKQAYEKYCRDLVAEEKAKLKEVEQVHKDRERDEEKRLKDLEKAQAQEARKHESNWKKAVRDEKLQKAADAAAVQEKKAATAKAKRGAGRRDKARKIVIARAVAADDCDEPSDMASEDPDPETPPTVPFTPSPAPESTPIPPRPRPRPVRRVAQRVTPEVIAGSSDKGREVSSSSDQGGNLPLLVPIVAQSEVELQPAAAGMDDGGPGNLEAVGDEIVVVDGENEVWERNYPAKDSDSDGGDMEEEGGGGDQQVPNSAGGKLLPG
ncbi:hypothetical protein HWV62_8649 [Athelia sp. TMB]|nr:hypothetical protein HWV62_8649 [Athelia sp. TMB]